MFFVVVVVVVGIYLLCNVVLVSAVQQHESAMTRVIFSKFPDQTPNLSPLQCTPRVLTTAPPGRSLKSLKPPSDETLAVPPAKAHGT